MIETICQLFINTIKSYPKDDLMLFKVKGHYTPISTEEFGEKVINFSLGLKALGLNAGDKLIILSENRPEWTMTDVATLCLGGITVPIYTNLSPEQIKYIVNDSDAKVVVCSNEELWGNVESIKSELSLVSHFITFLPDAPEGMKTFNDILELGKQKSQEEPELFDQLALAVKPADVASIIYTSGTTGEPKGVMLTHSNFISNVTSASSILPMSHDDTCLSFLPLSHSYERTVTFALLGTGCTVGYVESMETVAENMLEVRPTIMAAVPRLFEKIYAKVMDNVLSSSNLKRKIFFWALKVGKDYGSRHLEKKPIPGFLRFKRNLAHKLVFSKIIEKTGGRIRFFVSGAAPLSKDIAEFFYAMGIVILEAYGLTETSPAATFNTFKDLKFGTVGKPIPGVDVKIAEDGEILIKGPNVMKGYYKKDEETKEVIRGEWFYSGDIGYLDEDGFLVITDRKKDIIVTAGGKNVAPQQIENLLKTNLYITTAVAIGDAKRFISALIVPNFEKLEEYAKLNEISFTDRADLVAKDQIVDFVLSEVDKSLQDLAAYEKVKKIVLLDRDFEIAKGEVTPTLKVKRNIIEKKYAGIIESLYEE
ncbi:MAG: AMP-binding protein [Candidatus Aminicenantes bacterium]|nr:AMP-binding protein [Candidatus Aminicenantes bacterium]